MIVESIIIGSILGLMILIIVDLKGKLNKQMEVSSYRSRVIDALERENVEVNKDTTQLLEIIRSFTPEVELFEKYVGQRYKVIRNDENTFEIGEIVKLVNIHSDDISLYENDSGRTEYLYDIDCVEEHTEVELVDPSEVWVVNVSSRADGSSSEVYMTFEEAVRNARREFERRYELLKGSMDVSNHIIVISPDLRNYDVHMKDNHDSGFRIEIVPSRLYA